MFSCEFQGVLALVDVVLLQKQMFFHEYSHGDLTAKVLALNILYYTVLFSLKT